MKLLLDFFPIVLFFVAFKVWGIYVATVAAMPGVLAIFTSADFVSTRGQIGHDRPGSYH